VARGGHGLPKVSPRPAMPDPSRARHLAGGPPLKWPCGRFRDGLPAGRAACGRLLPLWIPHAICLCSNPDAFKVILDWLRYRRILLVPAVGPVENLLAPAQYFGLEPLVQAIQDLTKQDLKPKFVSRNLALMDGVRCGGSSSGGGGGGGSGGGGSGCSPENALPGGASQDQADAQRGEKLSFQAIHLQFFCEPTRSVWLTMILIGSGVVCCCLFVCLFVTSFFVSQHVVFGSL
jgi:hypothetical protein